MPERTSVEFHGDDVWINGHPTYAGRSWQGHRIEGLLLNSRMVQAIFDDRTLNRLDQLGMVAILGLFPECASQLADQHAPQAGVL